MPRVTYPPPPISPKSPPLTSGKRSTKMSSRMGSSAAGIDGPKSAGGGGEGQDGEGAHQNEQARNTKKVI